MELKHLHRVKKLIVINGMFMLLLIFGSGYLLNDFSRERYYHVFEEGDLQSMENLSLEINGVKELAAYQGALLMKMSGLQKNANIKLKTFKEGRALLESSIIANPNHTEWRFLRFMIQENAPKIVKYNNNLKEDKTVIINNFNACDKKLQGIIKNYSQKSMLLKLDDLPD